MKDYYKLLKVSQEATQEEIKRAFVEEVRKYHPDLYTGDKSFAEKQTAQLTEAYNILKDEASRKKYDKRLGRAGVIYGTTLGDITTLGEKVQQAPTPAKPRKRSIIGKIFRSRFLYILLFLVGIEIAIYFIFFK